MLTLADPAGGIRQATRGSVGAPTDHVERDAYLQGVAADPRVSMPVRQLVRDAQVGAIRVQSWRPQNSSHRRGGRTAGRIVSGKSIRAAGDACNHGACGARRMRTDEGKLSTSRVWRRLLVCPVNGKAWALWRQVQPRQCALREGGRISWTQWCMLCTKETSRFHSSRESW